MDGGMRAWIRVHVHELIHVWMDTQMTGCVDTWMDDRCLDGFGWLGGWITGTFSTGLSITCMFLAFNDMSLFYLDHEYS